MVKGFWWRFSVLLFTIMALVVIVTVAFLRVT